MSGFTLILGSHCVPPVRLHGKTQPPHPIKSGLYFSLKCDSGFKLAGNHYSLCYKGVIKSELGTCKKGEKTVCIIILEYKTVEI